MVVPPWQLHDPARLLTEIADTIPLVEGTALLTLMQRFDIPDRPRRPEHAGVTIVVREGLCVLGPNEGEWYRAWRYSNHLRNAFDGGLILVTRHGWVDVLSDTAGSSPAMAA